MQRAAGRGLEPGWKKGAKGEGKCWAGGGDRAGEDAGENGPRGLLENEGVDGSLLPGSHVPPAKNGGVEESADGSEEGREGRRAEGGGGGGGDNSGGVPPTLQRLAHLQEGCWQRQGDGRARG